MQNDISRPDTIHIVEPEIEEQLHYENTYDENRLSKDDDVIDIDVETIYSILSQQDQQLQPITSAIIRTLSAGHRIRIHMDSGANRSITPHKHLLHNLRRIPVEYVDGIGGQVRDEYVGNMKLRCNDDSYLWVQTYYHKDAPETIVSPNDIVMSS